MAARGEHLWKRGYVAALLGVSVSAVRRWQKRKELNGIKDCDGNFRFDRQEVLDFAAKRGRVSVTSGDIAAEIFDLFRQRKRLGEIVIATKQTPATVRALYAEWTTPLGAKPLDEGAEEREQAKHEEMMREWDRDLKERRRGIG
jgi:DNA-binding transcriptional MerR regulator